MKTPLRTMRRWLGNPPVRRRVLVATAWAELRKHGHHAVIQLGIQKEGGVEAHAWVTVNDVVINDDPDVVNRYAVFDGPLR